MVTDPDAVSAGALEDVAYLARSANRVTLLDVLASGSYTRRELDDETEIARTTIGRIVSEFEERGWAERTPDGEYTATPTGEQVVAEFLPLVGSIDGIRNLGDLVAWFQAAERPLDFRHLSTATVRRPGEDDPMELLDMFVDRIQEASEFRTLNHLAPARAFESAMRDRLVADRLTMSCVLTGDLVDYILGQSERRECWHDCIVAGADVYRYDGTVPCNLLILDETGYVAKSQSEYGDQYAMVESENDAVRSWASEIIEAHRTESDRLDACVFEPPAETGDDR